jgi:hypothetical protein
LLQSKEAYKNAGLEDWKGFKAVNLQDWRTGKASRLSTWKDIASQPGGPQGAGGYIYIERERQIIVWIT